MRDCVRPESPGSEFSRFLLIVVSSTLAVGHRGHGHHFSVRHRIVPTHSRAVRVSDPLPAHGWAVALSLRDQVPHENGD